MHEPPDAGSIAVLLERLEALGVPTPPAPPLHGGPETARYAGLLSRAVMRYAAREGRGVEAWPGMVLRAVQEGPLRPGAARPQRDRRPPLLPFHLADPPLPGPGLPPRAPGARSGLGGGEPPSAGLADLAAHCSQAERDAERLERRGTAICLAFLLERRLFDEGWDAPFEGEVVGLIEAGAFVRFGEVFEGFMPARLWRGERAVLDPLGVSLVARGGRRLRLGDGVIGRGRVHRPGPRSGCGSRIRTGHSAQSGR